MSSPGSPQTFASRLLRLRLGVEPYTSPASELAILTATTPDPNEPGVRPMTNLDTNLITRHATLARQYLANDPDVDIEYGEEALIAVVGEHVDALLVELERLTDQDVLDMLGSIDNALRNGSSMNNANLAFELLCERLDVDRERLQFAPDRIGEIAAEIGR
jgi:hypothetical protein